mmetsp:Transcript_44494/g.102845  ORF Transcript_44494/g.102845 Transcript_44494/m.102845 type:complete len:203 (+) Transcript_44494:58-666(+)
MGQLGICAPSARCMNGEQELVADCVTSHSRISVGRLWKAFAKAEFWWSDLKSEVWRSVLSSCSELEEDKFDLILAAEVVGWISCLKVYLGHDRGGWSTFSTAPCIENPPQTAPVVFFSGGGHFLVTLWPLMVNRIGRTLLSWLTGGRGEDECEFLLVGELDDLDLVALELRVHWLDDGVFQRSSLPFLTSFSPTAGATTTSL